MSFNSSRTAKRSNTVIPDEKFTDLDNVKMLALLVEIKVAGIVLCKVFMGMKIEVKHIVVLDKRNHDHLNVDRGDRHIIITKNKNNYKHRD